ncbi:hypothetical protein BFW41_06940 [Aeromonas hydrophila]|nr:hypothetical protein BFW41_06940 [Aeromonas hydrophila]
MFKWHAKWTGSHQILAVAMFVSLCNKPQWSTLDQQGDGMTVRRPTHLNIAFERCITFTTRNNKLEDCWRCVVAAVLIQMFRGWYRIEQPTVRSRVIRPGVCHVEPDRSPFISKDGHLMGNRMSFG